jgi:hypothetical protein
MGEISLIDVTLKELIEKAKLARIGRLLLADYSTLEPKRQGRAFVMMPVVRVIVTAFDAGSGAIYRWWEQQESKRTVTIVAGTNRGPNADPSMVTRKEVIRGLLRDEGFQVDDGEWTPEAARAAVDARKHVFG